MSFSHGKASSPAQQVVYSQRTTWDIRATPRQANYTARADTNKGAVKHCLIAKRRAGFLPRREFKAISAQSLGPTAMPWRQGGITFNADALDSMMAAKVIKVAVP